MLKSFITAVCVIGIILYVSKPQKMPSSRLPIYSSGQSLGHADIGGNCKKSLCAIIYVAPWCPVCQRLNSTLVAMKETLEEDGIQVNFVVGMDSESQLLTYAAEYKSPVLIDRGDLEKALKIRGVPYMIAYDHKGYIKGENSGGSEDIKSMRLSIGL